jgi:hypothetical protein
MRNFDIEAFKAFVASKPADEAYDGCDPSKCALAQFGYRSATKESVPADIFWAAVFNGPSSKKPRGWSTFGALADRLATPLDQSSEGRG